MNTKNVPVIVMLTAGLAASIVMFKMRYDLVNMLGTLLGVFILFYIFGVLMKKMLDRFCPVEKETEEETAAEDGSAENGGEENAGQQNTVQGQDGRSKDGAVIEK